MKNEGTRRHLGKLLKQRQIDARRILKAVNVADRHGQQVAARALHKLANLIGWSQICLGKHDRLLCP